MSGWPPHLGHRGWPDHPILAGLARGSRTIGDTSASHNEYMLPSMTMALRAKNKLGFVDGSIKPQKTPMSCNSGSNIMIL
jgi:hypothetical protein